MSLLMVRVYDSALVKEWSRKEFVNVRGQRRLTLKPKTYPQRSAEPKLSLLPSMEKLYRDPRQIKL